MDHRLGQSVDGPGFRPRGDHGLDVGGVTGFQATDEGVLADRAFGQKLLGCRATHGAGYGGHDDVVDVEAAEDALVGLTMCVVGVLEAGVVDVVGVGVLHDELAPAQDAGARTRLVAVFGLDLVERQRKVLVGAVLPLDRQGEDFFVGRRQQVVVVAAILEPKNAVAVLSPPVRRLVGRPRQQRREKDLLAADGVHLFAHDAFDLAQHPQAEWQPAVEARRDRSDVAGADQQLVAGDFGFGGVVAQRAQEQL